jgi:hypothetical protein
MALYRARQAAQNGFMESFNGKLRDECLNEHVFSSLAEARRLIESRHLDYNAERPHSSLSYLTPNEFATNWHAAHSMQQEPDASSRQAGNGSDRRGIWGLRVPPRCRNAHRRAN